MMQKIGMLALVVVAWLCFSSHAVAVEKITESHLDLQQRLNKIEGFSAQFTQIVTSADGKCNDNIVQQSTGKLWMQRPGLFRWETTSPEENLLVSDGRTLWFYTPEVEQVTATWLNSATDNTPFLLISSNQLSDWQRYQIRQQGDHFELTPIRVEGNLQRLTITVNPRGMIKQFALFEQGGQCSRFVLKKFRSGSIKKHLFSFIPPPGVTIDDQR